MTVDGGFKVFKLSQLKFKSYGILNPRMTLEESSIYANEDHLIGRPF